MKNEDIRWQQRLENFNRIMLHLEEALKIKQPNLIQKAGIIHFFEIGFELAWNVMKDFLENAGNTNIFGPKDAIREAFAKGLITNGDVWMDMIKSCNKTSHTYNEETADDIFMKIIQEYYQEFKQFKNRMEELLKENNEQ